MSRPSRWEGESGPGLARRLDLPLVEVHRTLGSTNDRAKALVQDGALPLTLVLADEQTAGKGRGGRSWRSPAGCGVWASMLVESGGPEVDGVLPLRVGLALARGLEAICDGTVRVKWPNDLFLQAAGKLGGILCERTTPGPGGAGPGARVVVGVGLNVLPVEVPDGYPAAFLADAGQADRRTVLECVVEAVRSAASSGSVVLSREEQAEWRARDLLSGVPVQVVGPGGEPRKGVARGIDARGRLLMDSGEGVHRVVAGTVRPQAADTGSRTPWIPSATPGEPGS